MSQSHLCICPLCFVAVIVSGSRKLDRKLFSISSLSASALLSYSVGIDVCVVFSHPAQNPRMGKGKNPIYSLQKQTANEPKRE